MEETRSSKASEFFELKNREDVARLLDISDRSLRYFLFKIRPERMYRTFKISKKRGGYREINAPDPKLKNIQKKLAIVLLDVYACYPKSSAHGFVEHKNIMTNATPHCGKKVVLNIDLADFFTHVNFGRIRGMLVNKPFSIGLEAATTIAQISCVNKVLPQGAPSSPIITNLICRSLDYHLMQFAKNHRMTYTRYADDLTFSSNKFIDKSVAYRTTTGVELGIELLDIINRNGFEVNSEKIHLSFPMNRQEVTGLVVNEFTNVRREYIKQIRAILHNVEKNGLLISAKRYVNEDKCKNSYIRSIILSKKELSEEQNEQISNWFKLVLKSKLHFLMNVRGANDKICLKYAEQYNTITGEDHFKTVLPDTLRDTILPNVVVLEDGTGPHQGSGFFLTNYGLFTSFHVTENDGFYRVYHPEEYEDTKICIVGNTCNLDTSNKVIDYAIYKVKNDNGMSLKLGNSTKIGLQDEVIIVGYPEFHKGATVFVETTRITEKRMYQGIELYTVSGKVQKGLSGGAVLNNKFEVIGIVKAGIASVDDNIVPTNQVNQGFIPIHLAINHAKTHRGETDI